MQMKLVMCQAQNKCHYQFNGLVKTTHEIHEDMLGVKELPDTSGTCQVYVTKANVEPKRMMGPVT